MSVNHKETHFEIEENNSEYNNETGDLSTQSPDSGSQSTLRNHIPLRYWLLNLLHSTKYQVFIVTLVVFDTLVVIIELLIDLELHGSPSKVPEILHNISISFLCLFVIEIFIKLYAYKMEFFTLKGEVFDAIVIIIALILDVVSINSHDAMTGTGLIIILRLWRIVRIQSSIVMSVRRSDEKRLEKERDHRIALESELDLVKEQNRKLMVCCKYLLKMLKENGYNPTLPCSLEDLDVDPDGLGYTHVSDH